MNTASSYVGLVQGDSTIFITKIQIYLRFELSHVIIGHWAFQLYSDDLVANIVVPCLIAVAWIRWKGDVKKVRRGRNICSTKRNIGQRGV